MKRILFESVDDYPRIDAMICEMFNIPRNARMLTTRVDARIDGDDPYADARRAEMTDAARAFVSSDRKTDIQVFPADQINPNHPPAVVGVGAFFRVLATMTLSFNEDGFGVGNSDAAVKQLKKGKPAGSVDPDICQLVTDGTHLEGFRDDDRADLLDYVAMVSRMYLPGLIRIAFADLGLMAYLCRTDPDARDVIEALSGRFPGVRRAVNQGGCNTARLQYFARRVIPALAIQGVIARGDPLGICDGGTLKQNEAFLGKDAARELRDYAQTLDVPLDSDLRTPDGKLLGYGDLLEALDVDDMQSADVVKRSTKDTNGKYYEYVPPEKPGGPGERDETGEPDGPELRLYGSDDNAALECPSYKVNDWYVVYVPDYEHSSNGWFRFDEPSAKGQGYKFWLNGRTSATGDYDTHRSVGDMWCIVFHGPSYWNEYGPGDEHTAYYLVHESALDDDVLRLSSGTDGYRTTTAGCILAGYDDGGKEYVRGMVRNRGGMMDRSNTFASELGSPFLERYMPKELIDLTIEHQDTTYRRNLLMLLAIGVWDTGITGWAEIKAEVARLSALYFPLQNNAGKGAGWRPEVRLIKADDAYDAAAVLQDALESPDGDALASIMDGRAVFAVRGAGQYRLQSVSRSTGYSVYALYPMDGEGGVYPLIKNSDDEVVPLSETPVPEYSLQRLAAEYHARFMGEFGDTGRPDYDGPGESEDGSPRFFKPFAGRASARRVGVDGEMNLYVEGPETDGEPLKVAERVQLPEEGRMCTYVAVEGGYNVIWSSTRESLELSAIGYVRNGKMRLFMVDYLSAKGTAVLTDGHYTLGRLDGDFLRFKDDRYQAFIAIDGGPIPRVADKLGLTEEACRELAGKRQDVIGLAIPNGRFDGVNAGTVTWFDSGTMAELGQTGITVDSLDRSRPAGDTRYHYL